MAVYDSSGSLRVNGDITTDNNLVTASFWVDGTPQPRIRTTASVAISGLSEFAETKGANVFFYVSGTLTTGSTDKVSVFGGSLFTSGNLYISPTASSQSFIDLKIADADPETPSTDRARVYVSKRASRAFGEIKGPSGLDVLFQPAIFNNAIAYAAPNTTTTLTSFGTNFTTSGTVAHNSPTNAIVSGILGTAKNARFTPAAAIGNGAGVRTTDTVCWRGTFPGAGGFFMFARFSVFINNPSRCFVGLNTVNGFLGHTTDISASTNFIGIGWDRNNPLTGTWRVMRKNASTYVTEEIPNMIRTNTTGSLIDFICFAPPSSSWICVQVIQHVSEAGVGVNSYSRWYQQYTSSLPTEASFLRGQIGIFNQTGSGASNIFMNRFYLETDY